MRTISYVFPVVSIRAAKRFVDASGKKRVRTRRFEQTLNPFNKTESGEVKTREIIMRELAAERNAWLAAPETEEA